MGYFRSPELEIFLEYGKCFSVFENWIHIDACLMFLDSSITLLMAKFSIPALFFPLAQNKD